MIDRLKNLVELSKYHTTDKDGEVVLETNAKPIGKASIIELEEDNISEDVETNK